MADKTPIVVDAIIQTRRYTAAQWAETNPVLYEGEMGFETDTRKFKFGDGSTSWNSLRYAVANAPEELEARIAALEESLGDIGTALDNINGE